MSADDAKEALLAGELSFVSSLTGLLRAAVMSAGPATAFLRAGSSSAERRLEATMSIGLAKELRRAGEASSATEGRWRAAAISFAEAIGDLRPTGGASSTIECRRVATMSSTTEPRRDCVLCEPTTEPRRDVGSSSAAKEPRRDEGAEGKERPSSTTEARLTGAAAEPAIRAAAVKAVERRVGGCMFY